MELRHWYLLQLSPSPVCYLTHKELGSAGVTGSAVSAWLPHRDYRYLSLLQITQSRDLLNPVHLSCSWYPTPRIHL
jgi:hypothetical protein